MATNNAVHRLYQISWEREEFSWALKPMGGAPPGKIPGAISIHRVDILASWNFHDIVNLNKIIIYNSVNLKLGYPQIEIRNPREVIHD